MKVLMLMGSARPQGTTRMIAKWAHQELTKRKDIEVEYVDLGELDLPFFNEALSPNMIANGMGDYKNPKGRAWAKKVGSADAFIFATPEYNHGAPALVKNSFDWVGKEWRYKPVTFISFGTVNGARSVEQLRLNMIEQYMVPIREALLIGGVFNGAFDDKGEPTDESLTPQLNHVTDELVKMAKVLQPLHA